MIVRAEKTKNYTVIANEVFTREDLSAKAKGLYGYLMTRPDDWKIYKSDLHKRFKDGRDSINGAFRELSEAGYITKEALRKEDGTFDGWGFTLHETVKKQENPKDGKPVSRKDQTTGNPQLPITEFNQDTDYKPNTNIQTDKGFEAFWEAYPRKVNKKRASSAYRNAKNLPPIEEHLEILEVWKRSDSWKKDEGKFIPHPTTWLNGERWADELPISGTLPITALETKEEKMAWLQFRREKGFEPRSVKEVKEFMRSKV
ncbi:MAG: hypothetical protein PQJ60_10810 [Spirochaetales bacterium]|nr:hypothetical protein [Spirochaetales bacterium]